MQGRFKSNQRNREKIVMKFSVENIGLALLIIAMGVECVRLVNRGEYNKYKADQPKRIYEDTHE